MKLDRAGAAGTVGVGAAVVAAGAELFGHASLLAWLLVIAGIVAMGIGVLLLGLSFARPVAELPHIGGQHTALRHARSERAEPQGVGGDLPALLLLLNEGVALVNRIRGGTDLGVGSTLERAVNDWAARVFAELINDHPAVAVYFDKPLEGSIFSHSHRSGDLKEALTSLLQRLSSFLQEPPRPPPPPTPDESDSELKAMLAGKYAAGLLSAYRDIVNRGAAFEQEIIVSEQSGSCPSADLAQRVGSWANRCIAFANDPKCPLTAEQRRAFRAWPAAPESFAALSEVVDANLSALRTVRDLFEPSLA